MYEENIIIGHFYYWKCDFSMTNHARLLVGRLIGRSVSNFLKGLLSEHLFVFFVMLDVADRVHR